MLIIPEERKISCEILKDQVDASVGRIPSDLYVKNVKIVDVYTETVFDGSFLVKHGKIVNINPGFSPEAARIVDGEGAFALPGFIDPCTHIDCSLVMPDALAAGYTPWGTTTVVGEINDLAAAQRENGVEAIHAYMKDRERLPFRMLCLAPGKGVDGEITARLLQDPDIAGQGENQGIFTLEGQRATLEKVVHNRVNQIYTNGHCEPFASTDEMCPFAICGAGVDHEAWTFEAVFERHRRGIRTSIQYMQGWDQFDLMIREIILNRRLPASNFMFAGDNTYIHDMVDHGILNLMVERAIKLGLSPVTAIKMATFNTAQELGLLQYIGSITPGRYADFSLVADLCSMTPKAVYKGGELVAQNGKLVSPVHINYDYFRTQHWTKGFQTLTVDELKGFFSAEGLPGNDDGCVLFPAISRAPEDRDHADSVFADGSCLLDLWVPCKDGTVQSDRKGDLLKVLFVERHADANGKRRFGRKIYHGFGFEKGALVMPHLTQIEGYVVLGASEEDMLCALRAADEYSGAVVYACDGQVQTCFDLNYASMISSSDAYTVTDSIHKLSQILHEQGCKREQILIDLWTAGFPLKNAPYFDI